MADFKKEYAENFFKFLNHQKFTEVKIIDPHEGLKEASFVDNLTDFLVICEKYNGKANVYVGVNERATKEGKAENVGRLSIIPLDVDPVRPKGEASTDTELELARQKILQIKSWLKENFDCSAFITMSGNGFHIFIKIPPVGLDDFNRPVIQQKLEIFVHQVQDKFNDDRVRIDSTFDLPRVMKCPGTLSVKGDNAPERPRRMCQIVESNDVPCTDVLNYLIQLKTGEKAEFKLGDKTQADFDALLQKDKKLRDLFEGKWEKYKFASRSEAEQSLVTKLVSCEFSEEAINAIMSETKIGKWNEKTESYRLRSIEKAVQFLKENNESAELKRFEYSCGKDLPDKVFEQTSSGDFLVFDKVTGETTKQKAVDNFKPFKRIIWKTVDNVQDYGSETQLWSEVKQYIFEHIDLQEGYDILTAWVLASWTTEKWDAVPYLFFYGPAASGKTWALQVLASIGFREIMTASATLSSIFRVVDMWHPTVFFDETEVYMRKDRGEILNLLNSGYRKDFPAMRTEEGKEGFEVRFYDCFGFKALAGTKDFMETLKSRCIIFNMSKAIRQIKTTVDEQRAKNLREKLLAYRFKMLTTKETQEAPNVLTGRLRELFNPLIIVAPTTEKSAIIEQGKKIETTLREEEETSLDSIVFKAIFKLHEETGDEKILIADIVKIVNETLEADEMLSSIAVGMVAKRLGFKKCSKGGKRAIRWTNEIAERLTYRYGRSEKQSVLQGKRFRKAVREFFEYAQ